MNLRDKPLEEINFEKLAELADGYSGADIRHICVKASLIPFKESISTGEDRKISMEDILSVMEKINPSISEEMVKKYRDFQF